MNYTGYLDSLMYGDVTGDGLDDAVFATDCFLGNDYVYYVEVWSHDDGGQPVQLPAVVSYTKWDGVIEGHEVEDVNPAHPHVRARSWRRDTPPQRLPSSRDDSVVIRRKQVDRRGAIASRHDARAGTATGTGTHY
jgi:hypothetical protein